MNLSTVKWAQWDKTQSRELLGLFICVCTAQCTIVAHNIAQNRPDNFPPYPPDKHHCSDDVYLREVGTYTTTLSSKFVTKSSVKIPSHLKRVATLPCEIYNTFFTQSSHHVVILSVPRPHCSMPNTLLPSGKSILCIVSDIAIPVLKRDVRTPIKLIFPYSA